MSDDQSGHPKVASVQPRVAALSLADVQDALDRVGEAIKRTPVLQADRLGEATGATVLLKPENLQLGGSFKIRGAMNRMSRLNPGEVRQGVVAYSSGNHAQAVGLAARLVGTHAVIFMPADAPTFKVERTRETGAEIVTYDRYRDDRAALATTVATETGRTLIPPYDDPFVICGQGTAALEFVTDIGRVDTLFVPIGGGGLAAGTCIAAKGLIPGVRVIGVEPVLADATKRSIEAGKRVRIQVKPTVADGLQPDTPGEITFPILRQLLHEVVTVSDEEILSALRLILEATKLLVEPSGAVAVAGLLQLGRSLEGQTAGVLLSGGNIGQDSLHALLHA